MSQRLTDGMESVPLPGLTVGEIRDSIEKTFKTMESILTKEVVADIMTHHLCGLAATRADERFDFDSYRSFRFRMEVAAGVAPKRQRPDLIKAAERACSLLCRVGIPGLGIREAVACETALRVAIAGAR